MPDEHQQQLKRNLFKRHKVATITLCAVLVFIIVGCVIIVAAANNKGAVPNIAKNGNSNSNGTIPFLSGTQGADNSTSDSSSQPPSCTSYQAIDSQTWLEIVKDPDAHNGECLTVYGEVTQFDAATGTSGFRANVGGVEQTPEYGFVDYPTNTTLVGNASTLSNVVEQDLFTANVIVLGSYTYQTQIGGQTTVPQLQVDSIQVTGNSKPLGFTNPARTLRPTLIGLHLGVGNFLRCGVFGRLFCKLVRPHAESSVLPVPVLPETHHQHVARLLTPVLRPENVGTLP